MNFSAIEPASKVVSFSGALASTTSVKTSTPMTTSVQTFAVSVTNKLPRTVSVTTASSTGAYTVGSTVVVTGTDASGNPLAETLSLTSADGNETVVGLKGFLTITQLVVSAQPSTAGSFSAGVQDVLAACRAVRVGSSGNLKCTYGDQSTDTIPSAINGETLLIKPYKIWGDAGTTAQNISIFL